MSPKLLFPQEEALLALSQEKLVAIPDSFLWSCGWAARDLFLVELGTSFFCPPTVLNNC